MSSFLFEKQQINCICFDNSPKNGRRIFRTDSGVSGKGNSKESMETLLSLRNNSEQGKQKKKSLKKEKSVSNCGSEKDAKKQQETHNNQIVVSENHTAFGVNHSKRQQKMVTFQEHHDQSHFMPIKSQRIKPIHGIRQQKPHVLFEPLEFEINHKKQPITPTLIHSQRRIRDEEEDKKISEQFQKDLRQFRQNMENVEQQRIGHKNATNKKRKESLSVNKNHHQQLMALSDPTHAIRYSATQHFLPFIESNKSSSGLMTFRNSSVSNKEKISIKKQKHKIQPKQIESQRDSNSQTESDKLSEVVGRGWDGLTSKRVSMCEISEDNNKREDGGMETMASKQSHIKSSHIHTLTEFSNIIASPKSMIHKGMAFGGGHKHGLTGMSFQQLHNVKQPKCTTSSKLIF